MTIPLFDKDQCNVPLDGRLDRSVQVVLNPSSLCFEFFSTSEDTNSCLDTDSAVGLV